MDDDPFGRGRRCRPFTILDAMILVVATAVALAYLRRTPDGYDYFRREIVRDSTICVWITGGEWVASPFLVTWTLAWLLIRARSPRARGVRLWRQPGLIACASACVAPVASFPSFCAYWRLWDEVLSLQLWYAMLFLVNPCGSFVLVAWGVLVVTRGWHPEPGWIDATGRTLGVSWVVLYVASLADKITRWQSW